MSRIGLARRVQLLPLWMWNHSVIFFFAICGIFLQLTLKWMFDCILCGSTSHKFYASVAGGKFPVAASRFGNHVVVAEPGTESKIVWWRFDALFSLEFSTNQHSLLRLYCISAFSCFSRLAWNKFSMVLPAIVSIVLFFCFPLKSYDGGVQPTVQDDWAINWIYSLTIGAHSLLITSLRIQQRFIFQV